VARPLVLLALVVALLTVGSTAQAERLGKGNSVVWIGLLGNKAQLIGPDTGPANIYEADEIGAHVAYSYFVSDQWAAVLSGSYGAGNEAFTAAGGGKQKETSKSFAGRIGFDRYAFINDQVALYAGPGLTYWTGRATYENSGNPLVDGDWPKVKQIGFNGRLGMYARMGNHYGLFGHIGQVLATNGRRTSGEEHLVDHAPRGECRTGVGFLAAALAVDGLLGF
jgi:hypothetical protein